MNAKNTYCLFILEEYGSFQHGEPSVFWSSIQSHMNWSKESTQMNFCTLVFLQQMLMVKIMKSSTGFTQTLYMKISHRMHFQKHNLQ